MARSIKQQVMLWGNIFILSGLFALDIRDLYFKICWIGPYDSFSFKAIGNVRVIESPMELSSSKAQAGETSLRTSGWSSFSAACETLHGSKFYTNLLGQNCSVGDPRHPHVVESVLMNAAVRTDAIAWACCKLLHIHRRPGLCQERIVNRFLKRYNLEDRTVPLSAMARAQSSAETELLHLLGVISRSAPLYRVVCVQAFEYAAAGIYHPSLYGCGNPSILESAFAGHAATHLRVLLHDMAWLTCDTLDIMGLQFRIRENSQSVFTMSDPGEWPVTGLHTTTINFSTSGQLYAFVIVVDVVLAALYLFSAVEILWLILIPTLLRRSDQQRMGELRGDDAGLFSMFSRSLYRSRPVVFLTVLSQLVSWVIILPNAVVWTWSISPKGKLLAYLSSIRVWVLLLIAFNTVWDLVVFLSERWAYAFARRTFLTTFELMFVGAAVAYMSRGELFAMGEAKYTVDRQRILDTNSFSMGQVGYANTYDDDSDGVGEPRGLPATSPRVLEIVYAPLFAILARSLACLAAFLMLKLAYLKCRSRLRRSRCTTVCESRKHAPYRRKPIEMLLATPIRAKSLIRARLELDLDSTSYVPAPMCLDFGVLVDPRIDTLCVRIGFLGDLIPPRVDLDVIRAADQRQDVTLTGLDVVGNDSSLPYAEKPGEN